MENKQERRTSFEIIAIAGEIEALKAIADLTTIGITERSDFEERKQALDAWARRVVAIVRNKGSQD